MSVSRQEEYQCNPSAFNTENSTPWPLSGHKILCDPSGNGLYLIGGWNPNYTDHSVSEQNFFDSCHYLRHVWKFNFTRKLWTKLKSENPPSGLASHCCCWLTASHILVYGGSLSPVGISGNSNETYTYDTKNEIWSRLPTTGQLCPEFCGHWFGQAACKSGEYLFVATGYILPEPGGVHLHRLNLRTFDWSELTAFDSTRRWAPKTRIRHDLVFYQEKLYLIGGGSDFRHGCYSMRTISCFDLRSNVWSEVETSPDVKSNLWPQPRQGQACVQDGAVVYMHGGFSDNSIEENQDWMAFVLNDSWTLDLSTMKWTLLPNASLPKPTWYHATDLSLDREKIFVFGGCTDIDYEIRSNLLYSVKVGDGPESLEYLCWQKVSKTFNYFNNFDDTWVEKLGINRKYVDKILF